MPLESYVAQTSPSMYCPTPLGFVSSAMGFLQSQLLRRHGSRTLILRAPLGADFLERVYIMIRIVPFVQSFSILSRVLFHSVVMLTYSQ